MTRSIIDLSWDELDALAQEAGAEAVGRAHAAGLSTFGVIESRRVLCYPDGDLSFATERLRADLDAVQTVRRDDSQSVAEPVAVVLTPDNVISRKAARGYKQKA